MDVHSATVSTALLDRIPGVTDLPGYAADGQLRLDAHHAARQVAYGSVDPVQRATAQRATLDAAADLGIGCVHEMAGPEVSSAEDLAGLLRLAGDAPGPQVLGWWGELAERGGLDVVAELGLAGAGGDLFCDGAFGSHTAALSTPYTDRPDTSGALRFDTGQLVEHVRACTAAGVQAGFHVIGDAAVDQVLAAVAAVADQLGRDAVRACRHRLEHVEMVSPDAVEAMRSLGMVASVQPAFDAAWGGDAGMYAERLGVDRALACNPAGRPVRRHGRHRPRQRRPGHPAGTVGRGARRRRPPHPRCRDAALRRLRRGHPRRLVRRPRGAPRRPPGRRRPGAPGPVGHRPDPVRGARAARPAHLHRPAGPWRRRPRSPVSARLTLDPALVARARELAELAAQPVIDLATQHTTVSVERAVLRLAGLEGTDPVTGEGEIPWVNRVVDVVREQVGLEHGVALPVWHAIASGAAAGLQDVAEQVGAGTARFAVPTGGDEERAREAALAAVGAGLGRVDAARRRGRSWWPPTATRPAVPGST